MHHIRSTLAFVSALVVAGCGSHASVHKSSYDSLHHSAQVPSATSSQQSSGSSAANGWTVKTHVNMMTDKKTIFAVDTSTASSSDYISRFPAMLVVACPGAGQKAQLFATDIATAYGMKGDSNGNGYPVNIRFDKHKPFKWELAYSSGAQGYFFADPAELIRKAGKSERMLIQYTRGDSSTTQVVVAFNMSGLNGALNKMHCTW